MPVQVSAARMLSTWLMLPLIWPLVLGWVGLIVVGLWLILGFVGLRRRETTSLAVRP